MRFAQLVHELGRGARPPGFNGFLLIVLLFPLQGGGQYLIERFGWVLTVPQGVIVKLRLPFGGEVKFHASEGRNKRSQCQPDFAV